MAWPVYAEVGYGGRSGRAVEGFGHLDQVEGEDDAANSVQADPLSPRHEGYCSGIPQVPSVLKRLHGKQRFGMGASVPVAHSSRVCVAARNDALEVTVAVSSL